jgi:hypothetical protein
MPDVIDEVIYTKNGYLPLSQLNSDCEGLDDSGFSAVPKLSDKKSLNNELYAL